MLPPEPLRCWTLSNIRPWNLVMDFRGRRVTRYDLRPPLLRIISLPVFFSKRNTPWQKYTFFFSFFFSLDTPKGNLEPSPLCYVEFIPKFSESFDSFFRRSESFRKGDGALWNFENVVKIYRYLVKSYHVSFNIGISFEMYPIGIISFRNRN